MTHATTRMDLEHVMLTEISQSQKDKYCMILLYEVARVVKFIETKSRMVVARAWEAGGRGVEGMGTYCLLGLEFEFARWKEFWRWVAVMVT